MKVDTSKMKKSSSELTPECRLLIDQLTKYRSKSDISRFLETISVWTYGKCELYHWTHILDRFDKILEEGARQVDDNEFMLYCDLKFSKEDVRLLLLVLNFTTLLIEHSFSRHLYNSVEHLTQLLSSQNMDIVLAVLNLLYMFSKRSNFIPRLSLEKKEMLLTKLYNIAERWGDPNYGLALIDCCIRKPKLEFLYQLSIEYSDENGQVVLLEIPDMVNTCKGLPIPEVIKAICGHMKNPSEAVKMRIAHRIRLVSGFKDKKLRLQFVQARLQAISVLIYSNALQDNVERILYSGFGEELCELIDKEDIYLVEIRAAVLRTLTSMLHFDRNPNVPRPGSRLAKIIQYTGAERQGGILPLLVRDCIISLTNEGICEKYPLVLATSLFSLLYHLASYEAGGHALVKSGMMKSLLQVINWSGVDLEHITFVTRAVRVIDLITNIDISKFHQCNGLNIFIDRMEKEINCCRDTLANLEIKGGFVDNMEQISNDSTDRRSSTGSFEFLDNIRKSCIRTNPLEVQQRLDKENFLHFAEKHRTVLNQILRQSPIHLSDGPFAVLVDHTRILDFDVKRKFFQTELERIDEGVRREENTVSVRRITVFEDSFRVLYRLGPEEWKNRFYIVFEDEEGQDAGGLLREWYVIISREIFNPMYALFCVSPGDRVTYMINPSSHANPNHLSYFKFVGRVIAKAIHDNKLLECYFTRSFYKHILGKQVKYTDMESQDYEFYKGLDYLMKNDISTLGYELTFSTEIQEFGVTQVRDLIPNGRNIAVTEENKFDYVQLVCQLKMSGSIRQQLDAFLEGFYDIIPKHLISIFNEQELELLISGLPDIDIEDLRANAEYHKYTSKSLQIQWFWRALRSFDQADRAKFLQFVTGTSKVPLQGFGSLEGMNGIQRFQIHRDDRSTDRLPCAHTCFNQLDLPMYKSYEKLRSSLLKAIHECSEGFGFA